ncbi:MAG: hypothetical protein ACK5MP_06035 [Nostocoides sp.]
MSKPTKVVAALLLGAVAMLSGAGMASAQTHDPIAVATGWGWGGGS